jgi:oxygen-independent coproporphyrinogen-3 oxidase
MPMTPAPPPLGLYVHLPWCIRKCPYCDFNSYEARHAIPEHDYVVALLRDLDAERALVPERALETIFIGGGTPSLFSGESVRALLDGVRERIATVPGLEITLEANPGAAEAQRFEAYRGAGVNRLSIGVQSFRDEALGALGRVHDGAAAAAAVTAARAAGFTNVNIDLMYGLPGDTRASALADLERGLALHPAHLSWYQLTLEPQTRFHRYPPELPDEDTVAAIEEAGRALLAAGGFERYEVSAYAMPGHRCRHNLNYWQFGDYLGIGAGAHGKLTRMDEGLIERRAKTRNPRAYLATAGGPDAVTIERIGAASALVAEFLMNGLRLVDGVDVDVFASRTGQPLQQIAAGLDEARRRGLLAADPDRLRATPRGFEALNSVLRLF